MSEKVIITFKNDTLVGKINDSSKKQALIEACDKLFSQTNSNVIVRLPLPDDNKLTASTQISAPQVEKKNIEELSKPIIKKEKIEERPVKPKLVKEVAENSQTEDEDNDSSEEDTEKLVNKKQEVDKTMLSDQVKMVVDLFDGKEII